MYWQTVTKLDSVVVLSLLIIDGALKQDVYSMVHVVIQNERRSTVVIQNVNEKLTESQPCSLQQAIHRHFWLIAEDVCLSPKLVFSD